MELVWYRMLAPLLGGSSYTFGLILAVALLGIGIGGGALRPHAAPAVRRRSRLRAHVRARSGLHRRSRSRSAIGSRSSRSSCGRSAEVGFFGRSSCWTARGVRRRAARGDRRGRPVSADHRPLGRGKSRASGATSASPIARTRLGAIVGSLAGGFGLLPLLSAPRRVGARRPSLLVVTALAALLPRVRLRGAPVRADRADPSATCGARGIAAVCTHRPDRGVAPLPDRRRARPTTSLSVVGVADLDDLAPSTGASTVRWEEDGVESSRRARADRRLRLHRERQGRRSRARRTRPTQVMSGLVAALVHPDPKTALVIGLGTGSTAGWLGAVPAIDRVDVVELEPAILARRARLRAGEPARARQPEGPRHARRRARGRC